MKNSKLVVQSLWADFVEHILGTVGPDYPEQRYPETELMANIDSDVETGDAMYPL